MLRLLTICLIICINLVHASDIDRLIEALGSKNYKERSEALKRANGLDLKTREDLIKRLKKSDDPELKFIANKIKQDDIQEKGYFKTASGLRYKIIKKGKGKKPGPTSKVETHYIGKLADGTIFDSSIDRGQSTTFSLTHAIKGWTEGLQLMREGAKYEFIIPPNLAYGEKGAGSGKIPPDAKLIFQIELIKVTEE